MSKFTKQAIYASFQKFLNEKPLDKITVKDLVEDCGINRKTFYYYFQDIYDLARQFFQEDLLRIRETLPPETHTWFDALKACFEYLYENRKITLHVFHSLGYEKISDLVYETSLFYLPRLIPQWAENSSLSGEEIQMIASCASETTASMATRWIRSGMEIPPAELFASYARALAVTTHLMQENADRLRREITK